MAVHVGSARAIGLIAMLLALGPTATAADGENPKDIGLVERAGRRLVQIDLSATRRDGSQPDLTASDIELRIGKTAITNFTLDRICGPLGWVDAEKNPCSSTGTGNGSPASFLFYFDESHLTSNGRARAIQAARDLVSRLIVDGNRGMIVTSGRRLLALTALTEDAHALQAALDRLEQDTGQRDAYAEGEAARIAQFESLVRETDLDSKQQEETYRRTRDLQEEGFPHDYCKFADFLNAPEGQEVDQGNPLRTRNANLAASLPRRLASAQIEAIARELQREELRRAEQALERVELSLLRLSDARPPKALIYFADTMRLNAGEHYFRTLNESIETRGFVRDGAPDAKRIGGTFDAFGLFDRIVALAGTRGIRVYPIEAAADPLAGGRFRDSRDALSSFAAETGGQAFLGGMDGAKIAGIVADDMKRLYLLSFDPAGLQQDKPLPVRIAVNVPGVKLRSLGRIVIESEKAMKASRRLAAFLNPQRGGDVVSVGVVPLGFDGKKYSALVQIGLPAEHPETVTWNLGASVVADGAVVEDFSRSISQGAASHPLVVENVVAIAPGAFQVVAVIENAFSNETWSDLMGEEWLDPGKRDVTLSPVAVLQPSAGQFVRGNATKTSGYLVKGESEPLRADLPTALVGLVCWRGRREGPLHVERTLRGATGVSFPAMDVEEGDDRCAQVRDIIPAGTLGEGEFHYEVVVATGEEPTRSERTFVVRLPSN